MCKLAKEIKFKETGDERGSLVVIEGAESIPFEVKRLYYIFNTLEGVSRGFHAHRKLKQVLVAVSGSCEIVLDDGSKRESVMLDDPSMAIYIDTCIWRELHQFSPDCVLLCLASEHYDESDYIRDYEEFMEICRKKRNQL